MSYHTESQVIHDDDYRTVRLVSIMHDGKEQFELETHYWKESDYVDLVSIRTRNRLATMQAGALLEWLSEGRRYEW